MRLSYCRAICLGVLVFVGCGSFSSANSKDHRKDPEKAIAVVAHLPLDGRAAQRLFLRQGTKGKVYLYIVQAAGKALSVVDLSDPKRPLFIKQVDYVNPDMAGTVLSVGTNTAVVETPQRGPALDPALLPVKTIEVLDMADVANPQVALRFEGVSTYLLDDGRQLIYLINGEGLWIVRHVEPLSAWEKAWYDSLNAR